MRYRKGSHCVYKTEYHIVWTPRYRRKLFVNNIKQEAENYFKNIEELHSDIEVIAVSVQPDHIHLVICIPPRIAVADVIQFIKSQSAKTFKAKYGFMQKAIYGRSGIWSRGYFVSTVGVNEKTILAYVNHQEKEDKGQLQFYPERS
jgi:putative transposase